MHADCNFNDNRLIRLNMVNDLGTEIVVRIPEKGNEDLLRVYHISGEFCAIVRKYLRLRAMSKIKTAKFLVPFAGGKCCPGAMGKKTFAKMAQQIARFLKLENPENYTKDSFRMIPSKFIDKGVTCSETESVATSSNVGMDNATNSTGYIR